ncbi:hypothetical protein BH10PLA2_BH10PLA2_31550 [soil metagenome]
MVVEQSGGRMCGSVAVSQSSFSAFFSDLDFFLLVLLAAYEYRRAFTRSARCSFYSSLQSSGRTDLSISEKTTIDGVNTCWDTHQNLVAKLKNLLCPTFDQAFPTLLEDLHQRGLLETTLVVAVGEFGRTPKIGQFTQSTNTQKTGRDHWPHAFTALLAGGGVRGGQIYGATTSDGGYVADKPMTPADLSATILHHLGIDYTRQYQDEVQRFPNRLSDGHAIRDLG